MTYTRGLSLFLGVLLAFSVVKARAETENAPKFQGAFKDWSVYTRQSGKDVICYALSKPLDKAPKNVRHGDVYFLVASWKSGAAKQQPNFLAGYALRASTPPRVRIGSDKFSMFVSGHEAFIESGVDEKKLIATMKRGSVMRIEAVSARGTDTLYEFSLKGISAALDKTRVLCP